MDIVDRTRRYLNSEILSHGGCIDRLSGIQNEAINVEAQQAQLGQMKQQVEIWNYLLSLLPPSSNEDTQ